MQRIELSDAYVPKYYEMDPEFEDLLFDGEELEEGMNVLLAVDDVRVTVTTGPDSSCSTRAQADKYNRWCRIVTPPQIRVLSDHDLVEFIGEYWDGTKKKFSVDYCHPWYVKKATMEEDLDTDDISLPYDEEKSFED